MCMCVGVVMCLEVQVSMEARDIRLHETGVTGGCEQPVCGCWERQGFGSAARAVHALNRGALALAPQLHTHTHTPGLVVCG